MSLVITLIHTPTANRLEFDHSGFDDLIGTTHDTLGHLVQTVSQRLDARPWVTVYYVLLSIHFRVKVLPDGKSTGPFIEIGTVPS